MVSFQYARSCTRNHCEVCQMGDPHEFTLQQNCHGEIPSVWTAQSPSLCLFEAPLPESLILGLIGRRLTWLILRMGKRIEAILTLVARRTIVTGTRQWETAGGWEEFSLKGGTRDSCQMWGPENSDKWRTHAVYNLKETWLHLESSAPPTPGSNYLGLRLPRRKAASGSDSQPDFTLSRRSSLSDVNFSKYRW